MSNSSSKFNSLVIKRASLAKTSLFSTYVALSILLPGCTSVSYTSPEMNLPDSWQYKVANPQEKGTTETKNGVNNHSQDKPWLLTCFDDSNLKKLLDIAKTDNLDLKVAAARLKQARCYYGINKSQLMPTIQANASASYNHLSKNTSSGEILQTPGFSSNLFDGSFDALWEIDLFGKINEQKKASKAKLEAAQWQKEAIWISLSGEIARNYLQWCGYQVQISILEQSIETYAKMLELIQQKNEAGIASPLELAQAQAQLAGAKALLPPIQGVCEQTMHRLDILVGKAPGFLNQQLSLPRVIPQSLQLPEAGIPSDLIRKRPDILAAERLLCSASGSTNAANLDFFPSFTLMGSYGNQSMFAQDFSKASSYYWSFIPGVKLPLFNAGRLKAQLNLSKAQQEEALYFYEKTVLSALEEVENALSHLKNSQRQQIALEEAVMAHQKVLEIASIQYQRGLISFLNVLQAQNTLLETQKALVNSQVDTSSHVISLCKALSGSWKE